MSERSVESRIGFMCGVDFMSEVGDATTTPVYASVEALKARRNCTDECGIVEVTITLRRVVEPGSLCCEKSK